MGPRMPGCHTGWFEFSAHFLRPGYANFDNTRYDSVRSVHAWMPDREIRKGSTVEAEFLESSHLGSHFLISASVDKDMLYESTCTLNSFIHRTVLEYYM
eukprot:COSAG02_NODE_6453_length_3561_cov_94.827267_4_plen_99_part_00